MALTEAKNVVAPLMNIVKFKGMSILQQLHLEERLFRTSSDNWCIINDGTNAPTIVMGVSGKPSELLDIKLVLQDKVPVVRRFTGGGTVVVDPGTIFVTFICNKDAVPSVELYPRPIMSWSGLIYEDVFRGIADFHLRENDYVFGDRKFGGNAQSISRRRWIHHTSFLWDYEVRNMAYLKVPRRAPDYRSARSHVEFVCHMKDYMSTSDFIDRTVKAVGTRFSLTPMQLEEGNIHGKTAFDHSSRLLTKAELEAAFASQTNLYGESTGLSQVQVDLKHVQSN
ncbi:putative lipoate-protein ligase A isoform X2 [Macadamia integrifolia]|nr:putative lipoate-protein ligase A isoform X2 [Macadamia integrifolia]XP_042498675.1 putative lipoate-protein ligase A isoform X2 [Macadamia integrifolia]XP_042498676.1 putative lipoate-protein ligase A isoform X2 [Macadamia integrifolia]XP_042498677.1 putative lipoate-protein ligase A isoform X2 [Macadamia integrifolia]